MKSIIFCLSLLTGLTLCGQPGTYKENINRNLAFESAGAGRLLILDNISGAIDVEGYDGETVVLEAVKTVKADRQEAIERGKQEVTLEVISKGEVIYIYMSNPCKRLDPAVVTAESLRQDDRGWNNCNWNPGYNYKFDYTLQVPRTVALQLSTINHGDISVRNIEGRLKVNNINGAIKLNGIAGATEAYTINGDLTLQYDRNPSGDSKYYTLNGDINANFQPGLSADLYFKSFNGDFFTDIDDLEMMAPQLERKQSSRGISFKVEGVQGVRIRNGGPRLDFETFNGDVYVKEKLEGLRH